MTRTRPVQCCMHGMVLAMRSLDAMLSARPPRLQSESRSAQPALGTGGQGRAEPDSEKSPAGGRRSTGSGLEQPATRRTSSRKRRPSRATAQQYARGIRLDPCQTRPRPGAAVPTQPRSRPRRALLQTLPEVLPCRTSFPAYFPTQSFVTSAAMVTRPQASGGAPQRCSCS